MAELYAHERLAKRVAQREKLPPCVYAQFPAYLLGADGPDPLFFHALWRYGAREFNFQKLGLRMHAARCAAFLCALTQFARTPAQRAYALGFFCHYALDQVLHPYVLYQCREGAFARKGGHGELEQAIDATLYLLDVPRADSWEPPLAQMGVFLVQPQAEREIDALLRRAVRTAYGGKEIASGEFCRAFAHLRWAKRMLAHPTPAKHALWRGLEDALRLSRVITSHSSPLRLPEGDFMNRSRSPWRDEKAPEVERRESVQELLDLAERRAAAYIACAQEVWAGRAEPEALAALTGNRSYSSDVPGSVEE